MDHYDPQVPVITTIPWTWSSPVPLEPQPTIDLDEWRKLLEDLKQARDAAIKVDDLTGQPDCVDPEKAKLEDRVRQLEELLAKPPEFVIVEGGGLEPGTYRVIDGKLYKAI